MIIEVPSVSPDALEMSNGGPPSDVVPSNVAPSDVAPSDLAPAPDEIVVTAREAPPPGDPLQEVNIKSYRVIQSVDQALVAPVATGDQSVLPATVRDDRKSTRLNSRHTCASRLPSSACTNKH